MAVARLLSLDEMRQCGFSDILEVNAPGSDTEQQSLRNTQLVGACAVGLVHLRPGRTDRVQGC